MSFVDIKRVTEVHFSNLRNMALYLKVWGEAERHDHLERP